MRPLHAAAAGLVLIAVDFRTVALDLLPDVVGWALLAYVVAVLVDIRVAVVPAIAAVLSLAELVLPYHVVQYDPIDGELIRTDQDLGYHEFIEFDHLSGGRLAMVLGAAVLAAATVLVLTETLYRRARRRGALRSARQLRAGGWVVCLLWPLPVVVGVVAGLLDGDGMEPVWDDPASRVALTGVVAVCGLAVLLLRDGREPWALRPGRERTLPSMQASSS